MSDDDIDFDRVVSDPSYRREVIAFLKAGEPTSIETETRNTLVAAGEAQPRP